MTDQDIRIAIAKELGWIENGLGPKGTLHDPKGCTCFDGPGCKMPDYLNDLNAMHEAEKTLSLCENGISDCQWHRYWTELDEGPAGCVGRMQLLHATARQRAEAFLRTVGRWKD